MRWLTPEEIAGLKAQLREPMKKPDVKTSEEVDAMLRTWSVEELAYELSTVRAEIALAMTLLDYEDTDAAYQTLRRAWYEMKGLEK